MRLKRPRILITAGPTREMFDPVRYLSNLSTGEMGYAISVEAKRRKSKVSLISGPTALKEPKGVKCYSIVSATDLKKACEKHLPEHDVLIMSAAVCDYTAKNVFKHKLKRASTTRFVLKKTPDIVAGLAKKHPKKLIIGFCLETEDWLEKAKTKCKKKKLDGIVANYISDRHNPFGRNEVKTALVNASGKTRILPKQSKRLIAKAILGWIDELREA